MKRLGCILAALVLLAGLFGCGSSPAPAAASTPSATLPVSTPAPTAAPTAAPTPVPSEAPAGWASLYTGFLEDNYDVISALWPEGLTGVGFIDLDLDGMPEMLLFDMGASATLGAQLFDCVDGEVSCVSSVLDAAAGAFGDAHMSQLSICASYFESFRLVKNAAGETYFRVVSANGSIDASWEDVIEFSCQDGYLTLRSACYRDSRCDAETGLIVSESYAANGQSCTADEYDAARAAADAVTDLGYEAAGVFLWTDMTRYDTTYDGLVAMACDAAEAYAPPA